ncbi:MAG: CsgG/HfaB family protein [Myxococcota bacterium]
MTSILLAAVLGATASDAKPVVAVLYFDNNTNQAEFDVLRKGLAEMMVTDLVAWDGVTVVERDRIEAVLGELKLQSSKAFDKSTTVKVGKLVGATHLIGGAFILQGDKLRVTARIINQRTGEVVGKGSVEVTDDKDRIFDIEQQLVDKLTVAIDLRLKDPTQRKRAKAPNLDALLQYSRAIDLSDRGRIDEAQKAMAAVVSKSPTFGMARERKEYLLKKLKEAEERRKDAVTDAVAALGKRADDELAKVKDFSKLPRPEQERMLLMRGLKAQFLARLLKQALSWRLDHPRVVKVGKEADALKIMQAWVANERALRDEATAWTPEHGVRGSLEFRDELLEQVKAAGFKERVTVSPIELTSDLAEFIVLGELNDGQNFDVAPPLGALVPAEFDVAMAELDEAIDQAEAAWKKAPPGNRRYEENLFARTIQTKAELLQELRRDDDAASAWQRLMDALPTSDSATRAEKAIKAIIEGSGNERRDHAEFERDLANCEDFHAPGEIRFHLRRAGLKGLDEIARILEEKCLGVPGLTSAWERFYSSLASTAARAEDCDRAKKWHLMKYTFGQVGPRGFGTYLERDEGWCTYGFSEDTLPALVRVSVTNNGYKDERDPLVRKGLQDLLEEEIGARGFAIESGGAYHGGNHLFWFDAEVRGDDWVVTVRSSGNDERRPVASKGGVLDLEAVLGPALGGLRDGAPPGPRKPVKKISLQLAVEYGRAMDLFEDRKWSEARAAFEALATKYPDVRPARMRAQLAAAKERKEQSR